MQQGETGSGVSKADTCTAVWELAGEGLTGDLLGAAGIGRVRLQLQVVNGLVSGT